MGKPKLLDLFCCQGGASAGYVEAGFDVIGVDIAPQPRYPYEFVQADALEYLTLNGHKFDAIHASPPCQAYSQSQRIQNNNHPELIPPTRALLTQLNIPWVMENVVGSPLENAVLLCGAMFGLGVYRHRLFESNVAMAAPTHPEHVRRVTKMGRKPVADEMMHVVGHFSGVPEARQRMGADWMSREGLREAIPPAYARWVGTRLMVALSEI